MPGDTPHAPFFTESFRFVASVEDAAEAREPLEAVLRSSRVTARTENDVTLLLAALVPAGS